jgi:hypothetical protein
VVLVVMEQQTLVVTVVQVFKYHLHLEIPHLNLDLSVVV